MGLDDTIERRRGTRIAAKGSYRDPVRSSHGHFVKASGLRWLCLRARTVAGGARGARQPTLQAVAANPATVWQAVTIGRWYSQGPKEVDIASATVLWVHSGMPTN